MYRLLSLALLSASTVRAQECHLDDECSAGYYCHSGICKLHLWIYLSLFLATMLLCLACYYKLFKLDQLRHDLVTA